MLGGPSSDLASCVAWSLPVLLPLWYPCYCACMMGVRSRVEAVLRRWEDEDERLGRGVYGWAVAGAGGDGSEGCACDRTLGVCGDRALYVEYAPLSRKRQLAAWVMQAGFRKYRRRHRRSLLSARERQDRHDRTARAAASGSDDNEARAAAAAVELLERADDLEAEEDAAALQG